MPVVYYLHGGEQAKTQLEAMKGCLAMTNAAVMAVLFLVFEVDLIAEGPAATDGLRPSGSAAAPQVADVAVSATSVVHPRRVMCRRSTTLRLRANRRVDVKNGGHHVVGDRIRRLFPVLCSC